MSMHRLHRHLTAFLLSLVFVFAAGTANARAAEAAIQGTVTVRLYEPEIELKALPFGAAQSQRNQPATDELEPRSAWSRDAERPTGLARGATAPLCRPHPRAPPTAS